MRRSQVSASPICRKVWCSRTSTGDASSACLEAGVLHFRGVSPLLPRPAAPLRSLCAAGRSVALQGLRGSNRRLRAKHNRRGLDKLERPDDFFRRRFVFPEMRGLEVRPVGFHSPVDFEHFLARGAILFRNSVQDKYAWLDAERFPSRQLCTARTARDRSRFPPSGRSAVVRCSHRHPDR
jgi:hypothetical protein